MTSKIARFFSFAQSVPSCIRNYKMDISDSLILLMGPKILLTNKDDDYPIIHGVLTIPRWCRISSINSITNIRASLHGQDVSLLGREFTPSIIQLTLGFFLRHLSQILLQEGGLGSCEPIIGHGRKGKLPNRLPGSASRGGSQNGREYPLNSHQSPPPTNQNFLKLLSYIITATNCVLSFQFFLETGNPPAQYRIVRSFLEEIQHHIPGMRYHLRA